MLVIGHRGAMAYEPENTLPSFERAIRLGADMIELDVQTLPSGEVIVMHDRHVDRTTDGSGYVWHYGFRELRRLDAGKGERVPTLQEVLDLVDGRVGVCIELKGPGTAAPVAAIIEEYVTRHGWRHEQFMVLSFHHPELLAFKTRHAPHITVGASTANIPLSLAAYAEELQAAVVVPDGDFLDRSFVDDAHVRGLRVFAYTVDSYYDTLLMQHLGVDGVFSNTPDVSLAALAGGNREPIRGGFDLDG